VPTYLYPHIYYGHSYLLPFRYQTLGR